MSHLLGPGEPPVGTVNTLVIRESGDAQLSYLRPRWERLTRVVERDDWEAYVDVSDGEKPNDVAALFAIRIGWDPPDGLLRGKVVFLGAGGSDLPQRIVKAASAFYRHGRVRETHVAELTRETYDVPDREAPPMGPSLGHLERWFPPPE